VAALVFALACDGRRTSVLLQIHAAGEGAPVPDELRVFVRQGATALFDDRRLPEQGPLVPAAPPFLGSVVLNLGDATGELEINVFGTRAGERIARGRVRVRADREKQTPARIDLLPVTAWPAVDGLLGLGPLGAPCARDEQCLTSFCVDGACCASSGCGICQTCGAAAAAGRCAPVSTGQVDEAPAGACGGERACDGQGGCRRGIGQACMAAGDCASGFCADGRCCDAACDGPCRTCAAPGAEGRCTPQPAGADPDRDCAAGQACDGQGRCGDACRADADCPAPDHCRNGACVPRAPNGAPCGPDAQDASGDHQCVSGACRDGRCCSATCGLCEACTGAGGTCAPVGVGQPDREGTRSCGGATACDGRGGCRKGNGQRCGAAGECASGFCVGGLCCDARCDAPCRSCATGTCAPVTGVVDPRTCADTRMCDARGECLKIDGVSCRSGQECASGFCRDGVCCNNACDASCFACGSGVCTVVIDAWDAECTAGRRCDRRGSCR
jgi:hypothetical protein